MTNVVNFAATMNTKRSAAETARRSAAAEQRRETERQDIADRLGGTVGAQIIADVVSGLKAKDEARRPMPAYCDPSNEVRGSKYAATERLDIAEIAKRVRADIKEAVASGLIPKGVKTSVQVRRYSGGQSCDVRVRALPDGFRVMSDAGASWRRQFGRDTRRDMPGGWQEMQSAELRDLLARLSAILNAYNRDNSDSMVDYFDVRFHGHATLDWQVRDALEDVEAAASPGTHWAPNSDSY